VKITPHIQRLRDAVLRGVRTLTRLALIAARQAWKSLGAAWNSRIRRRLTGPLLSTARVALLAGLVGAGTIAFLRAAVVTIPPTEIAVVQNNWGSGVAAEDLGAGKLFVIPGRSTVHRLSARTHYLRFGMDTEGNEYPSLELRAPDGLEIRLSVTVPYRITEGQAHQIVAEGRGSTYPIAARATVERVLLQEFAKLGQTEWSDVALLRGAEDAAWSEIALALEPFHLTPMGVHVTAAWFPPMYEVELQEQKLLEQRILTDQMLSDLDERQHEVLVEQEAQARAETELSAGYAFRMEETRIELEAEVLNVQHDDQRYRFERETEADNLYKKAVADGQLAIDKAEALRERLVNEALESTGGRLLLACEAAKNLRFKSVSLDANNPDVPSILDLDALARLLIGQ